MVFILSHVHVYIHNIVRACINWHTKYFTCLFLSGKIVNEKLTTKCPNLWYVCLESVAVHCTINLGIGICTLLLYLTGTTFWLCWLCDSAIPVHHSSPVVDWLVIFFLIISSSYATEEQLELFLYLTLEDQIHWKEFSSGKQTWIKRFDYLMENPYLLFYLPIRWERDRERVCLL